MTIQTMASAVANGDMYRTYAEQQTDGFIKPYNTSDAHLTYPAAIAASKIYTYADGITGGKINTYKDALR